MRIRPIRPRCLPVARLLAVLAALLGAPPIPAVDDQGNYVVWGHGRASCHTFRGVRGSEAEKGFRTWLMGYLTAYNAVTPETFRLSGERDMDALLDWLTDYCNDNPMHSLDQASRAMVGALYPDRLRSRTGSRPAWGSRRDDDRPE